MNPPYPAVQSAPDPAGPGAAPGGRDRPPAPPGIPGWRRRRASTDPGPPIGSPAAHQYCTRELLLASTRKGAPTAGPQGQEECRCGPRCAGGGPAREAPREGGGGGDRPGQEVHRHRHPPLQPQEQVGIEVASQQQGAGRRPGWWSTPPGSPRTPAGRADRRGAGSGKRRKDPRRIEKMWTRSNGGLWRAGMEGRRSAAPWIGNGPPSSNTDGKGTTGSHSSRTGLSSQARRGLVVFGA